MPSSQITEHRASALIECLPNTINNCDDRSVAKRECCEWLGDCGMKTIEATRRDRKRFGYRARARMYSSMVRKTVSGPPSQAGLGSA